MNPAHVHLMRQEAYEKHAKLALPNDIQLFVYLFDIPVGSFILS